MQPARQDLSIHPGSTYRDIFRLMHSAWVYRPINEGGGAPLRLNVPAHGIVGNWPVWVCGTVGLADLNRPPPNPRVHNAKWIDADTLEINAISATGTTVRGGELLYRRPVDLTGAVVVMRFYKNNTELFALTDGSGLIVEVSGVIKRELTAAQTSQLIGNWRYSLEITFGDGSIQTFAVGSATAASYFGGNAVPSCSSEYYVVTIGEQGPPGGGDSGTGVFQFNGRAGDVTLRADDVSEALGYVPAAEGRKGLAARTVDTSGTITPADIGGIVASISDTPITLTISGEAAAAWLTDGWPTVDILQLGAGAVTIAGDGFALTLHDDDTNVLDGAGAAVSAVRYGVDKWLLVGRLVAA